MVRTKKLTALILALVLVLGLAATALAQEDAAAAEENGAEAETVAAATEDAAATEEEQADEEDEAETVYVAIAAISDEYTAVPVILADIISQMHLIEGALVTVPYPLTTDFAGGTLSQADAFVATRASVAQAKEYDAIVAVSNWRNPASVCLSTMNAMASVAGETPLLVNADTVPVLVTDVDVRIAFAPANATQDIQLFGTTRSVLARTLAQAFVNTHGGTASVVSLAQQGEFGMEVRVAARVAEGITAANASFYTFNAEANTFAQFTPSFVWLDSRGYLHFTTTVGGEIIVSDVSLAPAPAPVVEEAPAPAPAPAADEVEEDEEEHVHDDDCDDD